MKRTKKKVAQDSILRARTRVRYPVPLLPGVFIITLLLKKAKEFIQVLLANTSLKSVFAYLRCMYEWVSKVNYLLPVSGWSEMGDPNINLPSVNHSNHSRPLTRVIIPKHTIIGH